VGQYTTPVDSILGGLMGLSKSSYSNGLQYYFFLNKITFFAQYSRNTYIGASIMVYWLSVGKRTGPRPLTERIRT